MRGDDAIGPLVIDALADMQLSQLELVDAGSDALGIIEYFEGRERVLIIDACRMGHEAGCIEVFEPGSIDMVLKPDPLSLHGLGLSESIRMAQSLEILPKDLKIVGIEPESIQFSGSLSAPVKSALKIVVNMVQNELDRVEQLAEA